MSKKIILTITLLTLINLIILVSAQITKNETEIYLEKGWNIVAGFSNTYQITSGSDIKSENIKAIYSYFAPAQQYVRFYPEPNGEEIDSLISNYNIDDDILIYSANWVYSEKEGYFRYDQDLPSSYGIKSLSDLEIFKEWNFIGITSNMLGEQINNIKGNCNILKICTYQRQNWECLSTGEIGTHTLADQEQEVGRGLVIKVSNDCKFRENSITPPPLP